MRNPAQFGQALVMTALALFAMCGLVGLAVDFGWNYFVRRNAQRAADMAALAAATAALSAVGQREPVVCGGELSCLSETACPSSPSASATDTYGRACHYAATNGFRNAEAQSVTVAAAVAVEGCPQASPCVPTAPGVSALYYVTVKVRQTVPQLFSAVLGNPVATAGAQATGAIIVSQSKSSLVLLNRETDEQQGSGPVQGQNFLDRNSNVTLQGAVILGSQCSGGNCGGVYAGDLQGSTYVNTPATMLRGVGQICAANLGCGSGTTWTASPTSGNPVWDSLFLDPMRGKGQPPLTNSVLPDKEVPGGVIAFTPEGSGTDEDPFILRPGRYYSTKQLKCGPACFQTVADNNPVRLGSSHFQFGTCGGTFDDFVFFGGLATSTNTKVTFSNGRYVLAGRNLNDAGMRLLTVGNGTELSDCRQKYGIQDGGELFVFTDAGYPGLDIQLNATPMIMATASSLGFGPSGISSGESVSYSLALNGLNRSHPAVINAGLERFAPALFWHDQRNSRIRHRANGEWDVSCPGATVDAPCRNEPVSSGDREFGIVAQPGMILNGLLYMPRGTWADITGDGFDGPLQLMTGAVSIGAAMTLRAPTEAVSRRTAALVE